MNDVRTSRESVQLRVLAPDVTTWRTPSGVTGVGHGSTRCRHAESKTLRGDFLPWKFASRVGTLTNGRCLKTHPEPAGSPGSGSGQFEIGLVTLATQRLKRTEEFLESYG